MLQVLKIGSFLKIFITCLHLELSYLGSSFLSLSSFHGESNGRGRESQREIGTRHLKAKIFLAKTAVLLEKEHIHLQKRADLH